MADYLLQCKTLHRDFLVGNQTVHALRNVSVGISAGEFVAVTGPSGSGKSTFMNLVGCLDTPTSGEILINGERVSDLDSTALASIRNRKIGFVFQQFNLLRRTSALDNVALPLLYARMSLRERRKKAAQSLQLVELGDRTNHHPSQLSGGQQQRVAIARALVNDPMIILADEPTGALDTQTGQEIMQLFRSLNANGITIIIVTHEPEIANYGSREIAFRDGEIVSDQPTTVDVQSLHRNREVRGN